MIGVFDQEAPSSRKGNTRRGAVLKTGEEGQLEEEEVMGVL